MPTRGPSGITHRFQWLFRSEGYVGYVLLTLAPLYSPEGFRARLACLIHTANVRSEPGSNPSIEVFESWLSTRPRPGPEGPGQRLPRYWHSKVTLIVKELSALCWSPFGVPRGPLGGLLLRVEEGE